MARRKTIAELEEQIANLQPYQEAFHCLMAGAERVTITSEIHSIEVIGIARAAGGVVIAINGDRCAAHYLSDLIAKWSHNGDPYWQDIARKATRLQKQAVEERYGIQFAAPRTNQP